MAFGKARPRAPWRVLTASARKLDLEDKTEARQIRALLQGWQSDAWNFRDSIPEVRFAVQFKANAMSRMRLFVGVEPEVGESDKPTPIENSDMPDQFASIATSALADLAVDEGQRRELLKKLSTSVDIPGEGRILGRTDPETGAETWSIRSTDEIQIRDDGYYMREIPDGPQGVIPWTKLDAELTSMSRVWVPHPRYELMADSPMRALLQPCEALLILRRMIRAEARSRLNRGILKVPTDFSIKVPEDDNEDPEADPFMAALTRAITEPIGDEGVASAYAPIVVRGPDDQKLEHLSLTVPFEKEAKEAREELVGNIATGLDIPREVVEGAADMNHWSMWLVDDNTFRHHLEPHAITLVDMLTAGYFRPRIEALGVPPEYARRLVVWYDPTELVTHPDQTSDAKDLYDRHAISAVALARIAGFGEKDMPSPEETVVRMLQNMRTPPANLVMAAVHQMFPGLTIPPIETSGTVPGVKPTGVDPGTGQPLQLPAGPQPPAAVDDAPPAAEPAEQPEHAPPAITASSVPHDRLSRKLAQIDRDLRSRLQTAANAAMLKRLERVGARLRQKVAKDETLRTRIAHRPNERVSAILGETLVAATGVDPKALMGEDWGNLRNQFYDWTEAAQKQALSVAIRLGSLAAEDDAVKAAETAMTLGRDTGWEVLSNALTNLGETLLYSPDPNTGVGEWGDLNPDTLVPTGTIRASLGIAGGATVQDMGLDTAGNATLPLGSPVGQIGTGSTIGELLTNAAAMETANYEWEHGPSLKPFDGHLNLDGVAFDSFDADALANSEGWPDNAFFFPGDHEGCTCDFTPLWVPTAETGEQEEAP